jgi:hypothetical protein
MATYSVQPHDDDLDDVAAIDPSALGLDLLSAEDTAALLAVIGPTGTPSASTFLDGTGTWSAVPTGPEGTVAGRRPGSLPAARHRPHRDSGALHHVVRSEPPGSR